MDVCIPTALTPVLWQSIRRSNPDCIGFPVGDLDITATLPSWPLVMMLSIGDPRSNGVLVSLHPFALWYSLQPLPRGLVNNDACPSFSHGEGRLEKYTLECDNTLALFYPCFCFCAISIVHAHRSAARHSRMRPKTCCSAIIRRCRTTSALLFASCLRVQRHDFRLLRCCRPTRPRVSLHVRFVNIFV